MIIVARLNMEIEKRRVFIGKAEMKKRNIKLL